MTVYFFYDLSQLIQPSQKASCIQNWHCFCFSVKKDKRKKQTHFGKTYNWHISIKNVNVQKSIFFTTLVIFKNHYNWNWWFIYIWRKIWFWYTTLYLPLWWLKLVVTVSLPLRVDSYFLNFAINSRQPLHQMRHQQSWIAALSFVS